MMAGFQIPALAAIALAIVAAVVGPAAACGPETDCMIGDRTYRIQVPQGQAEPFGALIYAHGYKGSAKAVMRNNALRALADEPTVCTHLFSPPSNTSLCLSSWF